eukprot:7447944-Alexandrium_andersonii.AAC.1
MRARAKRTRARRLRRAPKREAHGEHAIVRWRQPPVEKWAPAPRPDNLEHLHGVRRGAFGAALFR